MGKGKNNTRFKSFLLTRHGGIIFVTLCILLILTGSVLVGAESLLSRIGYQAKDDFQLASSFPADEIGPQSQESSLVSEDYSSMQFGTGSVLSDPNIQNILLIGSDTRGGEGYGNSDTMLLLSINSKTKQVKMVSFLRDLYVKINGMRDNRINASYAYGGPKLLIDTIESNFKIKIDNYASINFQSFEKAIDIVGGVRMNLTKAEARELNSHPDIYFINGRIQRVSTGMNTLNGAGALGYARIRHIDSDFGRTERQRKIVEAALSSLKHSNPVTLFNFANSIFPLVKTDLTNSQILSLISETSSVLSGQMQQTAIPVEGDYKPDEIRGMDVLVPDIEKNKEVIWKLLYNR